MRKLFVYAVKAVLIYLIQSSAYAVSYGGPMPTFEGSPKVIFKRYAPSQMALSTSSYSIPNASIVAFRTNSQDNSTFFGALLGPLGVLAVAAAESSVTKSTIGDDLLAIDVLAEFEDLIKTQHPDFFKLQQEESGAGLLLTLEPKAFLRIAADESTSIGIQLDVELLGADGGEKWKARYQFNPTTRLKLKGSGSWLANKNFQLREMILAGLSAEVNALRHDLKQLPYPPNTENTSCKLLPGATVVGSVQSYKNNFFVSHFVDKRTGILTLIYDPLQCDI